MMSSARWVIVVGVVACLLASGRDASANCQNGLTSQSVSGGNGVTLNSVLAASTPPCTVSVGPGTYVAPVGQFTISTGLVVRSTGGAAATVLVASSFTAVAIWP